MINREIRYLLLFIFAILSFPTQSFGQQMIVDDAAITESLVFEGWGGTEEAVIQPGIALSRAWNINPGIIFNTSNNTFDATNWLIESKIVPNGWSGERWAFGNVSALVFDFDGRLTQIYSYIPISRLLFNYNSFIHLNLGVEANHYGNSWEYDFTLGFRTDLSITRRMILLSEVYSISLDDLGFQAGLRFVLIPGKMESDITYGQGFDGNVKYPGCNIGISFLL